MHVAPSAAISSQSYTDLPFQDGKGISQSAAVDSGRRGVGEAEASQSDPARPQDGSSALRARTVAQVPAGPRAAASAGHAGDSTCSGTHFQRDLFAARLEMHYEPQVKKALQEAHKWIDGRRPPQSAVPAHEVSAVLDLLIDRDIQAGRPTSAWSGFASSSAVMEAAYDVLMQKPRPPHDSLAQWPGPPTDDRGDGAGPSLAADLSPAMFHSAQKADTPPGADSGLPTESTKSVVFHVVRTG